MIRYLWISQKSLDFIVVQGSLEGMDEADGNCIKSMKKSEEKGEGDLENNEEMTALMPIKHDSLYFKMNHKSRGLLLIFNHNTFDNNPYREGSNMDVNKIKDCFAKLSFEIQSYSNLSLKDIRTYIADVVAQDHSDRDCLAIFVLTHGDKGVLSAKDEDYNPADELWDQFTSNKCPTLTGKPKLFFIQACQGPKLDPGIRVVKSQARNVRPYKMPVQADFLIFYAPEDHFAFRNTENGAFWVTVLCDKLKKFYKTFDILTIFTYVNRRMAIEFESTHPKKQEYDKRKQCSYFRSSLTRTLIFNKH